MPNKSRAKGIRYQAKVRRWWTDRGIEVVDPNRSGYDGDDMRFDAHPSVSVEIKNQERTSLGEWVNQAHRQMADDDLAAVVIHHRRGKADVGDDYVTMSVSDFAAILDMIS